MLVVFGETTPPIQEQNLRQDVMRLAGATAASRTRFAKIRDAGTFDSVLGTGHGRFSDVLYYGALAPGGRGLQPTSHHTITTPSLAHSLKHANVAHFEIMTAEAGSLLDSLTHFYPELRVEPPFGNSPWALFAEDRKHLAPRLIRILQPVFSRFQTDLRQVEVSQTAGGSSYTEGYRVSLMSFSDEPDQYSWAIQTLLHELAHTIQGVNALGHIAEVNRKKTSQAAAHPRGQSGTYEVPVEAWGYGLDFWVSWKLLNPAYNIEAQAECFAALLMNDPNLKFAR